MICQRITCTHRKDPFMLLKDLSNIKGFLSCSQFFDICWNKLSVQLISCCFTSSSSKQESYNLWTLTTKATCRFLGYYCWAKSRSYSCSWPEFQSLARAFWCGGQGKGDHTHTHTDSTKHSTHHKLIYFHSFHQPNNRRYPLSQLSLEIVQYYNIKLDFSPTCDLDLTNYG